jgi:hypothetical protein
MGECPHGDMTGGVAGPTTGAASSRCDERLRVFLSPHLSVCVPTLPCNRGSLVSVFHSRTYPVACMQ